MFYDYHTHTAFSDDSDTPMTDMLDQAVRLGLAEIAVTDHYDPGYPDPEFPFEPDFEGYHRALEENQEVYANRIRIVKGLEIGILETELDRCRAAAEAYDYDYIIGSFHCALGEPLYNGHFYDDKTPRQAFIDYFQYVVDNIRRFDGYSCLGHLNLVSRYAEADADFRDYGDLVEEVFKIIIPQGKGIELNTSSFKYNMRCSCPSEEILRMYRQMGGEIITIGSDAHTPDRIADHFGDAEEYLRSLGFRYTSVFRQRKPDFVKL